MGLKKFKPTSPGVRGKTILTFDEITKSTPEKSLVSSKKRFGGRNNNGRITADHKGGGHKKLYRQIDFKRDKMAIPAMVAAIEYDPNRTARIALLHYVDGEKRYIICPEGLKVGKSRWLGKRPHVRGVVMNPVDHPHGGGEGKTSGGRHPCTPWGKPTKGYKTRKPKSSDR